MARKSGKWVIFETLPDGTLLKFYGHAPQSSLQLHLMKVVAFHTLVCTPTQRSWAESWPLATIEHMVIMFGGGVRRAVIVVRSCDTCWVNVIYDSQFRESSFFSDDIY